MHIFRKFRALLLMVLIWLVLGFSEGALADDIILNDLGGRAVQLSSYKGKPVIMLFWTTWCPYCREELKNLNQQYLQIEQQGIVVFGVNVNEPDYKVQRFFKNYQLNFRILLDKAGLLSDKYGLMGVPTYVLLDKTGEVISQSHSLPDNYKSLLLK
ncbi:MAG: TlpA family protein disulfide reductase [Candidatus Omnitrophota bacterium]